MKIITVLGARPQFIKAAMVSENLIAEDSFSEVIIHTGQHFDQNMSDIFFNEMGLPKPDYNLNINHLVFLIVRYEKDDRKNLIETLWKNLTIVSFKSSLVRVTF